MSSRTVRSQFILRILLFALAILSDSRITLASPEKATWRREILLAANDTSFAALVYSWDWPGTYYESSDSVTFTLRRNTDGSVLLQQPLWNTVHQMDPTTNVWTSKRTSTASLELNEAFAKYGLTPVPPYAHPLIQWALDDRGLYFMSIDREDKSKILRVDVLSMKDILAGHPELASPEYTNPLRISGIYCIGETLCYYLVLSAGQPSDIPCYEIILSLKPDRVRKAEAELWKQLWPR